MPSKKTKTKAESATGLASLLPRGPWMRRRGHREPSGGVQLWGLALRSFGGRSLGFRSVGVQGFRVYEFRV